ncbi:hypothetical protein [Teredinibacter franksiae]|nr:hypothetical protein [Teredinibacter franksiae]
MLAVKALGLQRRPTYASYEAIFHQHFHSTLNLDPLAQRERIKLAKK